MSSESAASPTRSDSPVIDPIPAETPRTRDFERFLTFIDAIVAIAITLLVLPLIDLAGELQRNESVSHLLSEHQPIIFGFLLSFIVIADLWLIQHRLLTHVLATNAALTTMLMIWTLTIVALPFATALVAAPGGSQQDATKILYVGSMVVSSCVLSTAALVLHRNQQLSDDQKPPGPANGFATSAGWAVALIIMLLLPAARYWPLCLVLISDRVPWLISRLTRAETSSEQWHTVQTEMIGQGPERNTHEPSHRCADHRGVPPRCR